MAKYVQRDKAITERVLQLWMKLHKHVYRSNLLIEYINTKHNSIKRYNSKLVYINTKHKHIEPAI